RGEGQAWANALFEDNAEFGFGFRVAIDKEQEYALELVDQLKDKIGNDLAGSIKTGVLGKSDKEISEQRARISEMKGKLQQAADAQAKQLLSVADYLVPRSVWMIGGDGWAYDIGYGGLDHVLASGKKVRILVLDTEVYSNTGGQSSKATPRAAVAKFAASGKGTARKDLGMIAASYGSIYVAQIAMGANPNQALKAIMEAEAYDGPSLVIAYSHCVAHGYDLKLGIDQQKLAVKSGFWPLYRYNPDRAEQGLNPFQLDSQAPSIPVQDYAYNEPRFKSLVANNSERAAMLLKDLQNDVNKRFAVYQKMAEQKESK
ncbi:MAG: thiamine pyrophosphate-dependent enzyme, partial [Legionellales bacterium]